MKIYSVTEFNREVNELLSDITVCVQGEISNFHISQNRFVWFEMKDDKSYFSCFMLTFQLKHELEDGMEIKVTGTPGLFLKSGRFNFKVKQIELVGEGSLKKEFELLKKKLDKEGLFAEERKRELPKFPQKIGLITSESAAAFTDVKRVLKNRWSGLEIYFYPVQVQGDPAIGQIVKALDYLNTKHKDLDLIILTRGGGSLEDLWSFNTEEVCRAVFASTIPVVSAVGHERDETLVDFVADVRAATPSNAAELVAPHKDDVEYQIDNLLKDQERNIDSLINDKKQVLVDFSSTLDNVIMSFAERIEHSIDLLKSYNPLSVLNRGYSVTRKNGIIIKDSSKLKKKDKIETQLYKGKFNSKIL